MANDSLMSNAMLTASLSAALLDARRLRDRYVAVSAQAEIGLPARLTNEKEVSYLYATMATVRELSRDGERRIANVQSALYAGASSQLRRAFQRAYDVGAKEARIPSEAPPVVNGRPLCCARGKASGAPAVVQGHWTVRSSGNNTAIPLVIHFCPFCGAKLPEVPA